MGDYRGFTTYAVISGEAAGSDGNTYDVEFDVRVMHGTYQTPDGAQHDSTFAFM